MSTLSNPGIAGRDLLVGRTLACTGASRGIGRAIVLAAAAQGATGICMHYLGDEETEREASALQQEIEGRWGDGGSEGRTGEAGTKVVLVKGDIGLEETGQAIIDTAIQRFGRLDVFVSNAGICQFSKFLDLTPELWHKTQQVNLNGAFYALSAAARAMSAQAPHPQSGTRGCIVAVSSISALVGGAEQCHYTPTKAALKSLIESMACSLGPLGIRCNCVLPGTIRTAINEEDLSNDGKREYMEKRTPLGRLGNPGDIAGATIFLASDLSRYMQGSSVLVDGGMFVNLQ
ncbi:NAD-P-binding protein [Tilletiaria anomala UBC 951]|uniref:NAD-P-binding protein n=1 Tax=Tilletiaria anomala (strain ATCC 24038 / CBS 436.72 / UBC 951) TaxID=1037660 RepID=A0A066VRC8_TILAU|nr:NAD-P-binding protein [Tilletiaria anomala UBC 951]KDN41324.1 NAD-P-binding protein [Tilletiaria anomala UBC 951]